MPKSVSPDALHYVSMGALRLPGAKRREVIGREGVYGERNRAINSFENEMEQRQGRASQPRHVGSKGALRRGPMLFTVSPNTQPHMAGSKEEQEFIQGVHSLSAIPGVVSVSCGKNWIPAGAQVASRARCSE
jgi:hypothetical protein